MSNIKRQLIFTNLETYHRNDVLKQYNSLLKSHYLGNYKFIINSCDNKLLSCHYLTTLNHVEFDNPICQYITNIIKEMPFIGLYCGILSTTYLINILELLTADEQSDLFNKKIIISNLDKIQKFITSYLDEIRQPLDLNAKKFIKFIVNKLKFMINNVEFNENLAINLVKGCIMAVDEETGKLGRFIIKTINGPNYTKVFNGVLYKLDENYKPSLEFYKKKQNLLIFTESINLIELNQIFINFNEFIEILQKAEIKIIASQKLIDKKLIFKLRRNNILAIERFGEDLIHALINSTNALPISDFSRIKWGTELNKYIGIVDNLKLIQLVDDYYLLFENNGNNNTITTLFVSYRTSFDDLNQLKALIRECINCIFTIYKTPYYLPKECDQNLILKLLNYDDSDIVLKHLMELFAKSMEDSFPKLTPQLQQDEENFYDIYLLKKNSISQTFLIVISLLHVGLYVCKE